MDGEGTNPSAQYKEEVKEYFQQEKFRKLHNRVARQNNESNKYYSYTSLEIKLTGALWQGDTIALQTFVRAFWASCYASSCGRSLCPRMQMTGNDWTNCGGKFTVQVVQELSTWETWWGCIFLPREEHGWAVHLGTARKVLVQDIPLLHKALQHETTGIGAGEKCSGSMQRRCYYQL